MVEFMKIGATHTLSHNQKDYFAAAKKGNKKVLKKLIESGNISNVDVKNDDGQTVLFVACFEAEEECVKYLVEQGANPNEPSDQGQTPLHAACYSGCIKIVSELVERGADFRFHDKDQRTAKDWALLNSNAKKRQLMVEYIVKTRMFAMTHSGRDVLLEHQSSMFMRRPSDNVGSMAQLFKRISSKGGGKNEATVKATASLMSLGYGKVYGGEKGGTLSTIPMIAESMLRHDDYGTTFPNNAFFVMEGMMFGPTKVTVKRLRHDPPKGGVVDLLIKECESIAHLRHPNVLLLMATCATDNLEGLVLVFERVYFGSLYHYLHEKNQQPASHSIVEAGVQMCDGLIYIHQSNLLHNYISSHSIFLTNCNTLKIGNFEYMVPMTIGGKASKIPGVASNRYLNAAYNWMPPEIMKGELSTEKSDIYGFCTVMWEMFTGFIPWAGHDAEQIERQVCNQKMLKVNDSRVPTKFVDVLTYGLQPNANNRKMNLEQIRDVLSLMPRGQRKSDKKASPATQINNHCSENLYDHFGLFGYWPSFSAESPGSSRSRRKVPTSDTKVQSSILRKESITPRPPSRKKHSSTLSFFDVHTKVSSSHSTAAVRNSEGRHSSTPVTSRSRRKSNRNKLQKCFAAKAPLHEELKLYCAKVKQHVAAANSLNPVDLDDEEVICPQQLRLHKVLNKELTSMFHRLNDHVNGCSDMNQCDKVPAPTKPIRTSLVNQLDVQIVSKDSAALSEAAVSDSVEDLTQHPSSSPISDGKTSEIEAQSADENKDGDWDQKSDSIVGGVNVNQPKMVSRPFVGIHESFQPLRKIQVDQSQVIKASSKPSGYLKDIDSCSITDMPCSPRACLEPYQLLNPKPDYLPTSPKPENSHIAIHQSSVITSLAQPKEPEVCPVNVKSLAAQIEKNVEAACTTSTPPSTLGLTSTCAVAPASMPDITETSLATSYNCSVCVAKPPASSTSIISTVANSAIIKTQPCSSAKCNNRLENESYQQESSPPKDIHQKISTFQSIVSQHEVKQQAWNKPSSQVTCMDLPKSCPVLISELVVEPKPSLQCSVVPVKARQAAYDCWTKAASSPADPPPVVNRADIFMRDKYKRPFHSTKNLAVVTNAYVSTSKSIEKISSDRTEVLRSVDSFLGHRVTPPPLLDVPVYDNNLSSMSHCDTSSLGQQVNVPQKSPLTASTTPLAASTTPLAASTTPPAASTTPAAASTTPPAASTTPAAASTTPAAASTTPLAASTTPLAASTIPLVVSKLPETSNGSSYVTSTADNSSAALVATSLIKDAAATLEADASVNRLHHIPVPKVEEKMDLSLENLGPSVDKLTTTSVMLKNTSSHDPTQPEGPTTDLATSPCRNLLSVEELILPPLLSSCSSHVTSAVDEDSISEFSLITPLVSYLQQDDKDSCSPVVQFSDSASSTHSDCHSTDDPNSTISNSIEDFYGTDVNNNVVCAPHYENYGENSCVGFTDAPVDILDQHTNTIDACDMAAVDENNNEIADMNFLQSSSDPPGGSSHFDDEKNCQINTQGDTFKMNVKGSDRGFLTDNKEILNKENVLRSISFKYNLSLHSSTPSSGPSSQRIKVLCENSPNRPTVITDLDDQTAQTCILQADENSVDVVINKDDKPAYSIKLSRTHTTSSNDGGLPLVTTKHAIETELYASEPFEDVKLDTNSEHHSSVKLGSTEQTLDSGTPATGAHLEKDLCYTQKNSQLEFLVVLKDKAVQDELVKATYSSEIKTCKDGESTEQCVNTGCHGLGYKKKSDASVTLSSRFSDTTEYRELPVKLDNL